MKIGKNHNIQLTNTGPDYRNQPTNQPINQTNQTNFSDDI